MKIHRSLAISLLALTALVPLAFSAGQVHAQQKKAASAAAVAAPRIDGFDVESSAQLTSGNELAFTLYGSPGGLARVQVGGATRTLLLEEVEAGVYEGTYTIGKQDRITATSTATANLRLGNRVASSVLDDSLVKGAGARWPGGKPASGVAPRIDRFEVEPPRRLQAGSDLYFKLVGTPGGSASIRIDGVRGKVALEEGSSGVYEGAYVIRQRDKIVPATVVTGNLRVGAQERTMVLNQPLVDANAGNAPAPRAQARPAPKAVVAAAPRCANCGTVEAVNVVEHKGDGSYLGMIAGGVAGAVLGSQIGSGSGTTVAQIAGAAGGAFAGNEIEKRMKTTKHYEVTVRLENGGSQMVSFPAQPAFRVGSRVRVENGTLVQN